MDKPHSKSKNYRWLDNAYMEKEVRAVVDFNPNLLPNISLAEQHDCCNCIEWQNSPNWQKCHL